MLEIIINEVGYEAVFYPKFQCELNYIEYYWVKLKRYTCVNCQCNFAELEKKNYYGSNGSCIFTYYQEVANRSKRWLWSYIDGLNEEERKHAGKVYKSHR
jgi:hypothetical protein